MSAVALAYPAGRGRDRVAELSDRVEELEEQVRQLREVIVPPIAFPAAWRLTRSEAAVLAAIVATKGYVCSKERMWNGIYGHLSPSDQPELRILDVFVCKIRRRLMEAQARITIETSWGRGWLIPPESLARIQHIVAVEQEAYAIASRQRKAG